MLSKAPFSIYNFAVAVQSYQILTILQVYADNPQGGVLFKENWFQT